ncbi:hypothetical protein K525DRAFT_247217 [Schizophyllum commune Loenen D]|nr:hypothetical protein K525DRAFT_247217 [Schizophyllum commune Loenen D]
MIQPERLVDSASGREVVAQQAERRSRRGRMLWADGRGSVACWRFSGTSKPSSARALRPAFPLFGQTGVRWPVQRSGRAVSCFPWPSGGPLATVKTLGDSKIWATGKILGDKQDARRLSDLKVTDFRTPSFCSTSPSCVSHQGRARVAIRFLVSGTLRLLALILARRGCELVLGTSTDGGGWENHLGCRGLGAFIVTHPHSLQPLYAFGGRSCHNVSARRRLPKHLNTAQDDQAGYVAPCLEVLR